MLDKACHSVTGLGHRLEGLTEAPKYSDVRLGGLAEPPWPTAHGVRSIAIRLVNGIQPGRHRRDGVSHRDG
jgi:hypothetical protein